MFFKYTATAKRTAVLKATQLAYGTRSLLFNRLLGEIRFPTTTQGILTIYISYPPSAPPLSAAFLLIYHPTPSCSLAAVSVLFTVRYSINSDVCETPRADAGLVNTSTHCPFLCATHISGVAAPIMLQHADLTALLALLTGGHHVAPRYSAERAQAGTKSPTS